MKFNSKMEIGSHEISAEGEPYFIADIGANHDGSLSKAIDLIHLAAEAGAHAAKFQHFTANTIVSKKGFEALGGQQSHQSKWKKSVYEVYQDASISLEWTERIVQECKKAGVQFFTSPYSLSLVEYIDQYVPAYKIGSGDITWLEIIECMATKGKPLLLACGASSIDEIDLAVRQVARHTSDVVIMQCNTNYTASLDNFKYINLNVLKEFKHRFPGAILGLSDHTPGHATVLGAIALGANIIEKHFTDSNDHDGPDHKFAMNPKAWKDMVLRSKELYLALGDGVKRVEENERETVVLQRRSVRVKRDLKNGHVLTNADLECLRPCPSTSLPAYELENVIGRVINKDLDKGESLEWTMLE